MPPLPPVTSVTPESATGGRGGKVTGAAKASSVVARRSPRVHHELVARIAPEECRAPPCEHVSGVDELDAAAGFGESVLLERLVERPPDACERPERSHHVTAHQHVVEIENVEQVRHP